MRRSLKMFGTERGALLVLACVLVVLACVLAAKSCNRANNSVVPIETNHAALNIADSTAVDDTTASNKGKSTRKRKSKSTKKKSAAKESINSFQRSHRDEPTQD